MLGFKFVGMHLVLFIIRASLMLLWSSTFVAVDSQGASRSLPPAGRYERAGECGLDFTV